MTMPEDGLLDTADVHVEFDPTFVPEEVLVDDNAEPDA